MLKNLLVLTVGLLTVFISDPALGDKKKKNPKLIFLSKSGHKESDMALIF